MGKISSWDGTGGPLTDVDSLAISLCPKAAIQKGEDKVFIGLGRSREDFEKRYRSIRSCTL